MLTALRLEIWVITYVDSLVVALWHLHADKATLELMDGLRIPAKVIIGADGINSKARQQPACLRVSALSVCHDHAPAYLVSCLPDCQQSQQREQRSTRMTCWLCACEASNPFA